jgi:hypothetical protein
MARETASHDDDEPVNSDTDAIHNALAKFIRETHKPRAEEGDGE